MKTRMKVLSGSVVLVAASVCFAQDGQMGSWKLDAAQSKIANGVARKTKVVLFSDQVRAQSQDLRDRLDFLKTNLERYLSYTIREGNGPELGRARFEVIRFAGCKIAWTSSVEFEQSPDIPKSIGNLNIASQVSVDLGSIDAVSTKIYVVEGMLKRGLTRALVLELKIRPGSPGFKNQMETNKRGRAEASVLDTKSHSFFFDVNDRGVAEDVAKAFADASSICRLRMK